MGLDYHANREHIDEVVEKQAMSMAKEPRRTKTEIYRETFSDDLEGVWFGKEKKDESKHEEIGRVYHSRPVRHVVLYRPEGCTLDPDDFVQEIIQYNESVGDKKSSTYENAA